MYGRKIQKIRNKFGLNKAEFAAKLGLSGTAIAKMENDLTNPSIETLKGFVVNFNVNLDSFLFNNGDLFVSKVKDVVQKEKTPDNAEKSIETPKMEEKKQISSGNDPFVFELLLENRMLRLKIDKINKIFIEDFEKNKDKQKFIELISRILM